MGGVSADEIYGIREDGTIFGSLGLEREAERQSEADAEAYSVAEHYAKLWTQAAVRQALQNTGA